MVFQNLDKLNVVIVSLWISMLSLWPVDRLWRKSSLDVVFIPRRPRCQLSWVLTANEQCQLIPRLSSLFVNTWTVKHSSNSAQIKPRLTLSDYGHTTVINQCSIRTFTHFHVFTTCQNVATVVISRARLNFSQLGRLTTMTNCCSCETKLCSNQLHVVIGFPKLKTVTCVKTSLESPSCQYQNVLTTRTTSPSCYDLISRSSLRSKVIVHDNSICSSNACLHMLLIRMYLEHTGFIK